MAEITATKMCHYCGAELPSEIPGFCPSCHTQLKDPETKLLKLPKYLSTQLTEFADNVEKDLEAYIKEAMKESGAEIKEIEEEFLKNTIDKMDAEYTRVMIGTKAIEKAACAHDTYEFLKVSISSKMTGDERKSFVMICKGIGVLAESIDKYIHAGGQCYGGTASTKLGNDSRNTESLN